LEVFGFRIADFGSSIPDFGKSTTDHWLLTVVFRNTIQRSTFSIQNCPLSLSLCVGWKVSGKRA